MLIYQDLLETFKWTHEQVVNSVMKRPNFHIYWVICKRQLKENEVSKLTRKSVTCA